MFSSDPYDLFFHLLTKNVYCVTRGGVTYDFSEVPLEVGDYYVRRGEDNTAAACYGLAYEANPKSREVLQRLAAVHQRLGNAEEAERFKRLLETISGESQAE